MAENLKRRVQRLSCWTAEVEPVPLPGGMTNLNYVVEDGGQRYFVRLGEDIPVHGVMRFQELSACRAAHAAGLSPAVHHQEPGALVLHFVDGRTLESTDVASDAYLGRVVELIKRCHHEVPKHLRGPAMVFWVFHTLRDYAHTLIAGDSRRIADVPRYRSCAEKLERAVGPVELVFGHNDLLAANILEANDRLWLIDWDYAGFNSPLFDLGGLASNNALSGAQEEWMLEAYFEHSLDDELRRRYTAMKCASLLRESMWSMVSEIHSTIEFDFVAYTEENLERFERAYASFESAY